jgi:hypothetical protein
MPFAGAGAAAMMGPIPSGGAQRAGYAAVTGVHVVPGQQQPQQ